MLHMEGGAAARLPRSTSALLHGPGNDLVEGVTIATRRTITRMWSSPADNEPLLLERMELF